MDKLQIMAPYSLKTKVVDGQYNTLAEESSPLGVFFALFVFESQGEGMKIWP